MAHVRWGERDENGGDKVCIHGTRVAFKGGEKFSVREHSILEINSRGEGYASTHFFPNRPNLISFQTVQDWI